MPRHTPAERTASGCRGGPAHLGEGGMPAAYGLFQVPRGMVRHIRLGRLHPRTGRDGLFLGQPCAGRALAARRHGIPAVILMPSDAPKVKIANTRAYGAEVILYDRATEDRDAIGARLTQNAG